MFRVVMFVVRKPGTTPENFRNHYERVHIPLMRKLGGELFPISHSRRYIARANDVTQDGSEMYPAVTISGVPSDFSYDAITEMTFESRQSFYDFSERLAEPEIAAKVAEDCAAFLDTSRTPSIAVIGELHETKRENVNGSLGQEKTPGNRDQQ
ncbi:HypE protein [Fusarium proliferatum]|uniref:EthD domain-containing protein n=2 Tax=Fusarium oxysporum TaxID=5507 RepID=A0A420MBF4_FUSOX|nr:HypE protein [Fusarium proliferatum]RKK06692.1 hypothetical protein BFJ65_g18590 [Fusarium oxysporum f. sp. cepae]RKK65332.1 hypothetical protein BFJ69_g16373 [Fusarium oxysporum]RKK26703.1 hypothetical protein BFJ67_g16514 [Fusarium oxysporum f. sp. cepae]RKK27727.1 hypothetical protein BFJ66_g16526 [Fusarium oxysporum f. sp. cepae]